MRIQKPKHNSFTSSTGKVSKHRILIRLKSELNTFLLQRRSASILKNKKNIRMGAETFKRIKLVKRLKKILTIVIHLVNMITISYRILDGNPKINETNPR